MRRRLRFLITTVMLLALAAGILIASSLFRTASAQKGGKVPVGGVQGGQISPEARQQILALLEEKKSRSTAQRKINSQLWYAMKERRGEAMTRGGEVRALRSAAVAAKMDSRDRILVDIKGDVNKETIQIIEKLGGEILYASDKAGAIRARVGMDQLEELAGIPSVKTVRPAAQAMTHRQLSPAGQISLAPEPSPFKFNSPGNRVSTAQARAALSVNFEQRAANIRRQLSTVLTTGAAPRAIQDGGTPVTNVGLATSAGDSAHRVAEARAFFGVTGAGVKIGVLSDSDDFREQSIASGDLPADVTVLPGQDGRPGAGEGTAMLEIVHDLAPGAKLYFATAFNGIDSFADNIRALRAAGCDVIVDDVIYGVESPFHDDIVTTAVEEVTADGALYFSSAGNDGNFNDGTSSVWEGDFKDSGTTLASLPGGTLHDFGSGVISNRVESNSPFILGLWWTDPLGGSANDYDLFILNNTLTAVVAASTDLQDGDDDPFEATFGAFANERILIFKVDGAQKRAIHVNNFGGQLGIGTPGATHGHATAANGYSVAAISAAVAGGGSFIGGPTSPIELFSSDGFRRVFFKSDGTAFTPGKFTFSCGGGELRKKPDITAADGVATNVPGFSPFFGTSAAAPHAAAIAGLLKSAKPKIKPNKVRQALTKTALDIEAAGVDRDSGAGVLDAFSALLYIGAPPAPFLQLGAVATTAFGGDGDVYIEPGETGRITVALTNTGGATALTPQATLTTTTPGVAITTASVTYPSIGSNGQTASNAVPFAFTLSPSAACGVTVEFTLTVNYVNSNVGPQVFTFRVQTGQPDATPAVYSYTGPPAPIPDSTPGGVNVPIVVSGLTGPISGLKFSFGGTACSADIGSTTVGLDHTWVGDLLITLTSPQGTTVVLGNSPGGTLNGGNNFCNTVLDDGATSLFQAILTGDAPWTGTFKPANPLAAFNGQNGNGTWTLNVTDQFPFDSGNVRAFSLSFSTFSCGTP